MNVTTDFFLFVLHLRYIKFFQFICVSTFSICLVHFSNVTALSIFYSCFFASNNSNYLLVLLSDFVWMSAVCLK